MNKVICDICGTAYPDTADQCPICGCSRNVEGLAAENAPQQSRERESAPRSHVKGGRFSTANVRKRNQEQNTYQPPKEKKGSFTEEEEQPQDANTVLVAVLLILIVLLLAATAFIFVRYFLPNIMVEETIPTTSAVEETESTTEETTEEPTIPCESLTLLSESEVELAGIGQYYLVNIEVMPADTTDRVLYSTSDESIAVINDEGRVEVVGEGAVTITVSCGSQQISCVINCVAEETTEETTEEPTEETTEETTEALLNITLYIDKSDFTLSFRGDSYQLKFNPELTAEDITWISENPNVATVENGLVKCISYGTTKVIAKYGDQEVVCIVRCAW